MKKDVNHYRLPNGEVTTSARVMGREWNKILDPLTALGFRVMGFDPGVLLCSPEGWGSFNLPLYAAQKISDCARKAGYIKPATRKAARLRKKRKPYEA